MKNFLKNHNNLWMRAKWLRNDSSALNFKEHSSHWNVTFLNVCLFCTCLAKPSLLVNFFWHLKHEFSCNSCFNLRCRRKQYLDLNVIAQLSHLDLLLIWWCVWQWRSKLLFLLKIIWQSLHSNVAAFCCISWFEVMWRKYWLFWVNFRRQYWQE